MIYVRACVAGLVLVGLFIAGMHGATMLRESCEKDQGTMVAGKCFGKDK